MIMSSRLHLQAPRWRISMMSMPGVSSMKIFALASLEDASARSRQFRSLSIPAR